MPTPVELPIVPSPDAPNPAAALLRRALGFMVADHYELEKAEEVAELLDELGPQHARALAKFKDLEATGYWTPEEMRHLGELSAVVERLTDAGRWD
jgi:hypothetical protein